MDEKRQTAPIDRADAQTPPGKSAFQPLLDTRGRVRIESWSGAGMILSLWAVDCSGRELELPLKSSLTDTAESSPISERLPTFWRFDSGEINIGEAARLSLALDVYTSVDARTWWIEVRARNPSQAVHAGGLWDLGDPGSVLFRAFGLTLHALGSPVKAELQWHDAGADPVHKATPTRQIANVDNRGLRLVQYSSGGANWWHPNHMAADGVMPLLRGGWALEIAGDVEPGVSGSRCEPLARINVNEPNETASWLVRPERFWQNFPTAIDVRPQSCNVELFAQSALRKGTVYELQPGEQKRRQITLEFVSVSSDEGYEMVAKARPPAPSQSAEPILNFSTNQVPPGIRAVVINEAGEQRLAQLLIAPDEFFNKRERIDEFGWRHYGEVFADHESLYTDDPVRAPLVSHYNNQYDLVLGFALQYLRTGDRGWYQLMDELALHVVDIDIYHTVEDRAEYNGGLFWHTNHYTDAGTATHRTFSSVAADPTDPVGTSGGPGPEHCYTTGLVLHWLLTGDQGSRDAVLELARWIDGWFDGEDLLLAQIWLAFRRDLPQALALVFGRGSGHALPLNRATGNLVVALLDAHEIDSADHWLNRAATVLRDTFDAEDDIAGRMLLDVEKNWSYTVFLQSVLRFLELKERRGELDADWLHARDGLVAYAQWMSQHERPYLESTETLEFVNDTWAAQDVRKYVLLVAASRYDPDSATDHLSAAEHIVAHVYARLKDSEERAFTRVQAILLSNLGIASWALEKGDVQLAPELHLQPHRTRVREWTAIARVGKRLRRGIRAFSPIRELRWLRSRMRGRMG